MGKIKEALGLGEVITFEDGTQLPCVPACLGELEDAMALWDKSIRSGLSIQAMYLPEHKEKKEALEELLYVACGRKIEKTELVNKISIADGGMGVSNFIDRFLGFIPRSTGTEEKQE